MHVRSVSTAVLPSLEAEPAAAPKRVAVPFALDRLEPSSPVAPLRAVASRTRSDPLSLAGLDALVAEARIAALAPEGAPDEVTFASLKKRLEAASAHLPQTYRDAVATPLLHELERLGPSGFRKLLEEDPRGSGPAGLLLDVAQAVLQRGEGFEARATAAFQEVVSDLYDGFLSAEDRRGVKPPDRGVLPPMVKWGANAAGPYTWPVTATSSLGVGAAIVSLPETNASAGLLAWPALAHETAGHDLLEADAGLRDELATVVRDALLAEGMPAAIAGYWSARIDEAAADVLGVLNMGPAAAVGLVGYFRAMNAAFGDSATLRSEGRAEDPHPADLARAYLAAETVRLLEFRGAASWADRLVAEADEDAGRIRLAGVAVTPGVAKASAAIVAKAIVRTRLAALEGHALGEIQDWRDRDEAIVAELRAALAKGRRVATAEKTTAKYAEGTFAAHVVAAAVYEAVAGTTKPGVVMDRMIEVLAGMHERHPEWGSGGAFARVG